MLTAYQAAVEKLLALGHELHAATPRKFDLEHMRVLMAALGNPERRFPSVLIAGTNGKGSTAATLAAILGAAGHRTALYTSPHLLRPNERIRIFSPGQDGEDISDAEFAEMHRRVEEAARRLTAEGKLPLAPSFFEMMTAMAFEYFASTGAEIAVLEVGMGGRLDATNIVEPMVAVITDIALDHQRYLGNTIGEIAREKAGIIRPGGVVVTLPQHPEANDVLGNTMLQRGARAVSAVPYVPEVSPGAARETGASAPASYRLEVMGEEITVASPLVGRHQLRNVALAIAAAEELDRAGFRVSAGDIERGIRQTRWPGRFQILPAKAGRPQVVLDAAHNPAGAWALRAALSQHFPCESPEESPLVLIFGAVRDKAIAEMTEVLFPVARHVIVTRAENPRSASPEEIRDAAARSGAQIVRAPGTGAALAAAFALAGEEGVVVVAGSIYLVGEALGILNAE
jgi:dihydrofolate synthase/folylpolyglutamate synthase